LLKRRHDEAGENCYLIANQEQDLAQYIDSADFISQQAVAGNQEYATHILFRDNKIAYALTIKYNFAHQYQIHGKVHADYNGLITASPYLEVFTDILKSIKFEGLCCIDYKMIENRPIIFEINPPLGMSLCPFFFSILKVL
jgi:predicted ATP-grasp superfamily ATP-dependent carboligase